MAEYIEHEKLIDALKIWQSQLIEAYGSDDEYVRCLNSVLYGVEAATVADVRPVVRGKWVPVIRYLENTVVGWECSVCGFGIDISEDGFNYCPKCGADMRECET